METRKVRWSMALCLSLFVFIFGDGRWGEAARPLQGSQFCLQPGCHSASKWLDNDPPSTDVTAHNAFLEYPPLNLSPSPGISPFDKISDAYLGSIHNIPSFNTSITDEVMCVGCHISMGSAHSGGAGTLPDTKTCGKCHNSGTGFDSDAFLTTPHANPNNTPGKLFDQPSNKKAKATTFVDLLQTPVALFKANQRTAVTQSERIEECSVCHDYALEYPIIKKKLGQGKIDPQVGCPACHDAHIPAPDGNHLPMVSSTVTVTGLSGSTVLAIKGGTGRSVSYRNLKPYKIDATGAQNLTAGEWDRGSNFISPNLTLISGTGSVSNGTGTSTRFTFSGGGFLSKVHVHDTLFVSGSASATSTLPAAALNAGASVTVRADLDKAGFDIVSVIDDNNLEIDPGVIATASVTYARTTTPPATGTLSVPIPFSGSFSFEIRNMNTNEPTLCGSCHTQGKYKFTAWGKEPDGTFIDQSPTHNVDVLTQYRTSGHADIEALAFAEFSARPYGTGHVTTYPFDMNITGSGGVGTLRNGGNTTFTLTTQTPNSVYLAAVGNTFLPMLGNNNYQCFQCHNGIGTIDYLMDRQGTAAASVLWGDANPNCYTCHDPHADQNGGGQNVRVPVKLSYNSRFVDPVKNPRGGINKFMDGTNIPSNVENGIICLFCHQGRESGLTVYLAIKGKVDPYTNPSRVIDAVNGVSFINPHYLESGAILWSRNAWEFFFGNVAQKYSNGIPAHQELNCMDCHMGEANANNTEGGHTFRPRLETCTQCHTETTSFGPITAFSDIPALGDYDGNGRVESAFKEIGTIGDPVLGDSGLFGQLKVALATQSPPIFYDPNTYPYFFADLAKTVTFKAWTTNTLAAAFNLSFMFKAGNCAPYHNAYYSSQILQDSLKALGVDTSNYFRPDFLLRDATDYRTIVINP